jgi:uncharacterized protein (DUF2062 family)
MVHETHFSRFSFFQLTNVMKQRWQELVQTNASPQSIALAFAVGTFISVLPTPGLNLVLATLLASLFKQLNRTGLLAAIAVWNAFVVAPIYVLSHKVGASLPILSGHNLAIGFLVGNMLLAVVITAVSYLVVQSGISRYKTQKIRA